jgi:hypothetical protein
MKLLGVSMLTIGLLGIAFAAGPDPYDVKSLRREYEYLQSLSPARQQQLRDLDRDFNELDPDTREHLQRVMVNFNYWLAHLPEEDRKRVVDAETPTARLDVIREIKDREWIETLPKKYQEEYAKASPVDRLRRLREWREEDRERRDEWHFVRQNWKEAQEDLSVLIPEGLQFRAHLDAYAHNLEFQVSQQDRERLHKTRIAAVQEGRMYGYWRVVLELSERYTLLPGPPDGPRNFESLPKSLAASLEQKKKKTLPRELVAAQGRWPDFAIAVTENARQRRIALPEQLGPAKKADMPPDVRDFIEKELEPALAKAARHEKNEKADKKERADQASRDLARLHDAEGKWPEYPRTVLDLARSYKLFMVGWMLPGKPEFWDRLRPKTVKKP